MTRTRIAGVLVLVLLGAVGAASVAQANEPAQGPSNPGIFIPPNEQHPAVALPIFRKSNRGVYVSVGTERSFIGAALTRAKALYVIDYDPEAIRFANINRALLAASTNRADYVNLRLKGSERVWQVRSQGLTGENKETLASPNSWSFWNKKVRKNELAWDSAFGHFDTEPKHSTDPFFASDYLFDDNLFSHLSLLAKRSHIWSRLLDLRNENDVRTFCGELKSKGIPVGVIDTSDVPNSSEDGTSVAARYVTVFSHCAQDNTLFLNTAPAGGHGVHWSYYAFSNKQVRGHDQATIKQWYETEMKKIAASEQLRAHQDDPDAINP